MSNFNINLLLLITETDKVARTMHKITLCKCRQCDFATEHDSQRHPSEIGVKSVTVTGHIF